MKWWISSSFPGKLWTNSMTSSQLACQLHWYCRGEGSNSGKPEFFQAFFCATASVPHLTVMIFSAFITFFLIGTCLRYNFWSVHLDTAIVEPFTFNFSIIITVENVCQNTKGAFREDCLIFPDLIMTEKKFDNLTSWNYAVSNNWVFSLTLY